MITLVTSKIKKGSPDIDLLQRFEQYCAKHSDWKVRSGPVLFAPSGLSSRLYTLVHRLLKPLFRNYTMNGAIVSLGLPYHYYLYSKTFPYFTLNSSLKVLWTYDVWEPDYKSVENLIRTSGVNLLLLSSYQATRHFKNLKISDCQVHWIPETINPADYKHKKWSERSINVLSFGRSWLTYHHKIKDGCKDLHINYLYQERNETTDVAVQGLKRNLQFPTWSSFIDGLADSQICICFPRTLTHPKLAGNVSTLTIRYLQAMASKCLIVGVAPMEVKLLLNYNPVIEVDWADPVGQLARILEHPEDWQALIEKNYDTVYRFFHHNNALSQIDSLIKKQLNAESQPL
jgi:hypothetical protein